MTDLNDMSGQILVSGGPLGSRFVLAGSAAFYFLDGQQLKRAPVDNSTPDPLPLIAQVAQGRETGAFRLRLLQRQRRADLQRHPRGGELSPRLNLVHLGAEHITLRANHVDLRGDASCVPVPGDLRGAPRGLDL